MCTALPTFQPVALKLCRRFLHSERMCKCFTYNHPIKFFFFFYFVNLVIFCNRSIYRVGIMCAGRLLQLLKNCFETLYML